MGSLFTWKGNHGVAERSDFPIMHTQVWSDACDLGFMVRSQRTDKLVLFTLIDRTYDAENDLISTLYTSYCGKYIIAIYND
jgi:hypothetical protein